MKYYCVFNSGKLYAVTSCKEEAERILSREKRETVNPERYCMIEASDAKGLKPMYYAKFNSSLELESVKGGEMKYLEAERIWELDGNYYCNVMADTLSKAISLSKKRLRNYIIEKNAKLLEERDSE